MKLPIKILSYIVPLIVGALVMWMIIPKDTDDKKALQDKEKVIQEKIDSISLLTRRIEEKTALWIIIDKERKDSLKVALNKATSYQKKYEKVISTPVIRYSAPQLDSVILKIIGR